jgi:hypothetical protein
VVRKEIGSSEPIVILKADMKKYIIKMRFLNELICVSIVIFLTGCVGTQYFNKIPDCNYERLVGKEFVIRAGYFSIDWTHKPYATWGQGIVSPRIRNGNRYVGMKGKLHRNRVSIRGKGTSISLNYQMATLENCEEIYIRSNSYGQSRTLDELQETSIYFSETLNKSNTLIGKTIWINNNTYKNQELATDNEGISYPLQHLEEVVVVGTKTDNVDIILGAGPFCLVAKKNNGETGYLKYNDLYFYRKNPIKPTWTQDVVKIIKQRKVKISMTTEQVIISWGKPDDINKSVGSWGVHEQWVYGDGHYLYFEDGILTSYSD